MEINNPEQKLYNDMMNFSSDLKRKVMSGFSSDIDFKFQKDDIEEAIGQFVSELSSNQVNIPLYLDNLNSGDITEFMAAKDVGYSITDLSSLAGLNVNEILKDILALSIDIERLNRSVSSIIQNTELLQEIELQCKNMLYSKIPDCDYKHINTDSISFYE